MTKLKTKGFWAALILFFYSPCRWHSRICRTSQISLALRWRAILMVPRLKAGGFMA